jgi:hypothetical protein
MKGKDTFRKVYRPLTEDAKILIEAIIDQAEEFLLLLEKVKSREMSLAQTNLEQCTMWATKAIVLDDEMNNSGVKTV